jgi:hypothetical protein
MLQAATGDGYALDLVALGADLLGASEIDVSRRHVAEALMIAGVVVAVDEGRDALFEIARQAIVVEQDAVLERLMPALDLALGLRVVGRAADMIHALVGEL